MTHKTDENTSKSLFQGKYLSHRTVRRILLSGDKNASSRLIEDKMHPTDRLNNVLYHRVLRDYLLSISRTRRLEGRGIPEVSQVKKGERASIEKTGSSSQI